MSSIAQKLSPLKSTLKKRKIKVSEKQVNKNEHNTSSPQMYVCLCWHSNKNGTFHNAAVSLHLEDPAFAEHWQAINYHTSYLWWILAG